MLAACGVECAALPTAYLSTHTGGFGEPVVRDLTAEMVPSARHWRRAEVLFDAFYFGYLSSQEQAGAAREIFRLFRDQKPLMLVDPVMGDEGRLYSRMTVEIEREIAVLCAQADVITPNLTEAALLLHQEYEPRPSRDRVIDMARALSRLGPRRVVLTGVRCLNTGIGVACYDADVGWVNLIMGEETPGHFHGTGDLFASALLAGLLHGKTLDQAARIAVDFTADSVRLTAACRTQERLGLLFETLLPGLAAYFRDEIAAAE